MFCTKCGAKLNEGARFCVVCGSSQSPSLVGSEELRQEQQPQTPTYEQPQYSTPQYEQPPYTPPQQEQPQPSYEQPQYAPPQYEQPQPQPSYEQPQYTPPQPTNTQPPYTPQNNPYGGGYQQQPTISPYGATPPTQNTVKKKSRSKIIIPIVSGVVVLIIAFCVLWFTGVLPFGANRSDGNDNNAVETTNGGAEIVNDDTINAIDTTDANDTVDPDSEDDLNPDTPPEALAQIPGNGGVVQVPEATRFEFTPSQTGIWMLLTSADGESDPFLEVFDANGNLFKHDDDSGHGMNALIIANFNAGQTYTIDARFFGRGHGSYTLTVSRPERIPAGGTEVVVREPTLFEFSPSTDGLWDFRTSGNVSSDPILVLLDSTGEMIARNDDGAGGLNALITQDLRSGEQVFIFANFVVGVGESGGGRYTLNVSINDGVEPTTAGSGDLLAPTGGTVRVNGSTNFRFSPNASGFWVFRTSDSGSSDPLLEIFDSNGVRIAVDDDGGGATLDALLPVFLNANEEYRVHATFFANGTGSYQLAFAPAPTISSGGDTVRVNGHSVFAFSPNESGEWIFETFNNSGDPILGLFDVNLELIAVDDDGGDGLNSLIHANLIAGEQYVIYAGFYGAAGSYDLYVG